MRGGAFLKGKEGRVGFRRSLKVQGRTGGFSKDPSLMGKSGANERNESSLSNCRVQPALSKKEGELQKDSVWAKFAYTASDGKTYLVDYYNLDVIISVGYRVKSIQGTKFRIWATSILRQYLLQGYSVNRHLIALQENMDKRMTRIEDVQAKQQQQLDFFIRTSTPPAEMVFFEGDFYTARVALENLIRTANHRVVIIDGFVSSLTLSVLDVRKSNVAASIVCPCGLSRTKNRSSAAGVDL